MIASELGMPQPDRMRFKDDSGNTVVHHLKGQKLEFYLDVDPFMTKEDAIATQGLNGDILAVIQLPEDKPGGKSKEIALVDFGPNTSKDSATPLAILHGRVVQSMGYTKERYGLFGLNYTPETHATPFATLDRGVTVLGHNDRLENYRLGIHDDTEEDQGAGISPEHLSIEILDNIVKLEDNSEQGTTIYTTQLI